MPLRSILVVSIMLTAYSQAQADGGTVRFSEPAGPYLVTVFTAPTPFRAGPVDISVFVQHAHTKECVTQVNVTLRLTQRTTHHVVEQTATTAAATNKLFQAAVFDLPAPGWWEVEIKMTGPDGPAQMRFTVEADQPAPRWQELWPWYSWPALAIILFGLHTQFRRK